MTKAQINEEKLRKALFSFRKNLMQMSFRDYSKFTGINEMTLMRTESRLTSSHMQILLMMYVAGLRIEDFIDEEEGIGVQKILL